MKRFLSVVLSVLLFSVPAYAADTVRYIPIVPEFLTISGTSVNVNVPLYKSDSSVQAFFSDFYSKPYLILLDQWTATNMYPQFATTGGLPQVDIGEDRKWSISFVMPADSSRFSGYDFVYFDPEIYFRQSEPRPMRLDYRGTDPNRLSVLTYHYNFTEKKFGSPILYTVQDLIPFSYVIGSAAISGSSGGYPVFNKVGGKPFTVTPYAVNGLSPHYSWWRGIGSPTNNVIPSEPDEPSSSSVPDFPDVTPDKPLIPFDPSTDNGGYLPPSSSSSYDPLPPDYFPPLMPSIPDRPPDLSDGGSNPFEPPDLSDGGSNPFEPPNLSDGGNNPFLPPDLSDGGNNPFLPPDLSDGGNNPFLPPDLSDGGNNPFLPPDLSDGGNNPFEPPNLSDGGNNPFEPPNLSDGGNNPFKPPRFSSGGYNPFLPPVIKDGGFSWLDFLWFDGSPAQLWGDSR